MKYPILIERGSDTTAFGVVVPDLPGCFSAGDTLDEAVQNAQEAIYGWIEVTIDTGGTIPPPSTLEAVRALPDYQGWIIDAVEIDRPR